MLFSTLLPGIGLIGGLSISLALWKWKGREVGKAFLLMAWAAPLILLGGKLFYVLEQGRPFAAAAWAEPGYSLYGSFFAVISFWFTVALIKPFPVLQLFDCVTPGAAFALVLGRIKCFMVGCCGGTVCDGPWAVRFSAGTPVFADQVERGLISQSGSLSLPVHPTQLCEAAFALAFGLILLVLARRNRRPGVVFFTGVLGYSLFRFAIEFVRIHPDGSHLIGGLSMAQVFALGSAVVATAWLLAHLPGRNSLSITARVERRKRQAKSTS
ncbi:MAG: hypothetical protein EHM61_10985 [Acidobacteria bacterium]|nr:MAG: hypothetical protein EHM61_10985 [Acidobacteriota bacterium]